MIGVYHRDFDAIHQSDRIDPGFTVLEAIVYTLDSGAFKNACRICKRDRMPADVRKVLFGIPGEPHKARS